MRHASIIVVLMFMLTILTGAQGTPSQASPTQPPSGTASGRPATEQRQRMMQMHQQHLAAMKADLDKMKASLAQMKSNVASINDPAEKARWQSNVDMWEVLVGHMERMLKHMESMGPSGDRMPGMMHDMGGPPSSAPPDQQPH